VPAFRLAVLGSTNLVASSGAPVEEVLRQPKLLALLTYLAITTADGFRRRDQVIAYFWPDLDQVQARTRLRKALHQLREALCPEAIASRGEDEVQVVPDHLWCDAVALARGAAAAQWRETLPLYRGPLLEGLFVEGVAQEFEEWLDEQRARLRRQAAQAAWACSRAEEAGGDRVAAAVMARRALELAPDDEEGVRRLMALLDAHGDRGGALKVYTEWQARMRAVYGVEPAPETRRLARRVQAARKGESHETPPATARVASATEPIAHAADGNPGVPGRPRTARGRRWLATVAVLAVLGAAAIAYVRGGPPASSVAVLPLREIGDGDGGAADRVSEELGTALAGTRGLTVRVVTRASEATERGDAHQLGRRLGVAWVVDGGVQHGGTLLRVTMRLVRVADGVSVWAGSWDKDQRNPIAAARQIATEATTQITAWVLR
jgi:DNA-binding SARP family transcriptional activator/TolB-like protein